MKKKKSISSYLEPGKQYGKLNEILALQRQNDIITMLLEGKDTKTIMVPYLTKKYHITPGTANFFISQGRKIIKKRLLHETNALVSLHIDRYEKIYAGLYEIGAYGTSMNALKAKEKLMGFHKEGFHMKITQGEISSLTLGSSEDDYDPSKLQPQKQQRLLFLISKMKKDGLDKDRKVIQ